MMIVLEDNLHKNRNKHSAILITRLLLIEEEESKGGKALASLVTSSPTSWMFAYLYFIR